jgi:hypothetical protein
MRERHASSTGARVPGRLHKKGAGFDAIVANLRKSGSRAARSSSAARPLYRSWPAGRARLAARQFASDATFERETAYVGTFRTPATSCATLASRSAMPRTRRARRS